MRFCSLLLIPLLFLALVSAPAAAAVYKWVDDNGTVTFKDTPPPPGKQATVVEMKPAGIVDDKPVNPAGSPGVVGTKAFPPVELYVTSWCGYCKKARAFLQGRGVAFKEYDIERDPAAARRMAVLNKRGGVPVAVIGDQTLVGFYQPSYETALGMKP